MNQTNKAIALAQRGFKVFPLRNNTKLPVFKDPFNKASNDINEVRKMFTSRYYKDGSVSLINKDQDYNIAISTGKDIIVLDCDNKHGLTGTQNLLDFLNISLDELKEYTLVVETPNNGHHIYFKTTLGVYRNSVSDILEGVDIKSFRSSIVAPGTVIDNKEYKEVSSYEYSFDTLPGIYPELDALLDIHNKKLSEQDILDIEESRNNVNRYTDFEFVDDELVIANAVRYLESQDGSIAGQHSNTLFKIGCRLKEIGCSLDTSLELISEIYLDKCEEDISDRFHVPVESAYTYCTNASGSSSVLSDFDDIKVTARFEEHDVPENIDEEEDDDFMSDFIDIKVTARFEEPIMPEVNNKQEDEEDMAWKFGNLKAIHTIPKRPWLIQDLLLNGDVTTLSAVGAGGKTTMLLGIAVGLAVGQEFIYGFKNNRYGNPVKSIIHSAEDSLDELSRRIHGYCIENNINPDSIKDMIALSSGKNRRLTFAKMDKNGNCVTGIEALNSIVELVNTDNNIGFIGLDPLSNLHECVENDSISMTYLMSIFNNLASATGCAIMLMHHTTKSSDGSVFSTRGSGAIINSSRVALILNSLSKEECKELDIPEEDAPRISYIAEGKSNMSEKKGIKRFYYMKSVEIGNGDSVGVHTYYDIQQKALDAKFAVADNVRNYIRRNGNDRLPLKKITDALKMVICPDICGKKTVNELNEYILNIIRATERDIIDLDEDGNYIFIVQKEKCEVEDINL